MRSFRAFISHSSADKEFVDLVFASLDRASVFYDRYEFDDGDLFTPEIAARIAECGIFVLLASKPALSSKWVNLELQQAQVLREAGLLNDTLLFALGDVSHRDFPQWLQLISITPAVNPAHVAAAIQEKQLQVIDRIQNLAFLNRHDEMARGEQYLRGPEERFNARKTLALFGQAGFGRHRFGRQLFRNVCGLDKNFRLTFESGDSFRDTAVKLAQFGSKYTSLDELQIAIDEVAACDEAELSSRVEACLSSTVTANTLLMIEDNGGFLDADGFLTVAAHMILVAIDKVPGCYAAVITRRKPNSNESPRLQGIAIGDLPRDSAMALVHAYADAANVRFKSDQEIPKLIDVVGNHPAALRYAIELSREYGLEALLADTRFITSNNIERYWQEIAHDSSLTKLHKAALRTLAAYEASNLEILAQSLNVETSVTAAAVRHLIDLVLVTVESEQYRLCSALYDVVPRLFPDVRISHDRSYRAYTDFLDRNPDVPNRLSLERARGVALSLSSDPDRHAKIILLAADYIKVADTAYRNERFNMAFDYAEMALDRRPGNADAIRIYIQAGVKLRHFNEATNCIDENEGALQPHTAEYFRGFIERGKNDYEAALNHYKRSLDLGRRGLAIHRELSLCFYRLGYVEDAEQHLAQAFNEVYGKNNPYLLDLGIRLAISQDDEVRAREYLRDSAIYDKPHHAKMLKAAVELAFGDPDLGVKALSEMASGMPYFAKYLKAVASLRMNDLVMAQRQIQEVRWNGDAIDVQLLQAALLWCRGKVEEGLLGLMGSGAEPRLEELRQFMLENPDRSDQSTRQRLSVILIKQGAMSTKK